MTFLKLRGNDFLPSDFLASDLAALDICALVDHGDPRIFVEQMSAAFQRKLVVTIKALSCGIFKRTHSRFGVTGDGADVVRHHSAGFHLSCY